MAMMVGVQAHLNGGPRDDIYIEVEGPELRVAIGPRMREVLKQGPDAEPMFPKVGRYVMRRDSNGDPVPHDLTGVVEFDWDWR